MIFLIIEISKKSLKLGVFIVKYFSSKLFYGIENYNLNTNETKSIKRAESNCLKIAFKLSTTELLLALKILSTKQHIKKLKLAFFIRLTSYH